MRYKLRLLFAGLILLILMGCQLSSALLDSGLPKVVSELDAPAATLAMQRTRSAQANQPAIGQATLTPEIVSLIQTDVPCAYVWDTMPLPEETAEIQVAFQRNGLGRAEVWATAYGERCVNVETKTTVGGFLIVQTDFHVRMQIQDIADEDALGRLVADMTRTVLSLPEGTFPGKQKGYVSAAFIQEDEVLEMAFLLKDAEAALGEGLQGAALLQRLRTR